VTLMCTQISTLREGNITVGDTVRLLNLRTGVDLVVPKVKLRSALRKVFDSEAGDEVCVAPHADDEVITHSARLATARRASGAIVAVADLGNGCVDREGLGADLYRLREDEAIKAHRILGSSGLLFLRFPGIGRAARTEAATASTSLTAILQYFSPSIVSTVSALERHRTHRRVLAILVAALRRLSPYRPQSLLGGPVWGTLPYAPQLLRGFQYRQDAVACVKAAIRAYQSQSDCDYLSKLSRDRAYALAFAPDPRTPPCGIHYVEPSLEMRALLSSPAWSLRDYAELVYAESLEHMYPARSATSTPPAICASPSDARALPLVSA